MMINDSQQRFFEENGFAILDNFLSDEEVDFFNKYFDVSFTLPDSINNESGILNIFDHLEPRLLSTFKNFFGDDAKLGGVQAESKTPNNGLDTPWHQDESYWDESSKYNGGGYMGNTSRYE